VITNRFRRPSILGRELDKVSGVYALIDPRTSVVMYVGQSINIGVRYRQHCDPEQWAGNFPKMSWINELSREGLLPSIEVIERCDWPESDTAEKEAIRRFKADGQCELNITIGGGGRAISKTANTSKDDWIQLGRKIKLAREILCEAQRDAWHMIGRKSSKMDVVMRKLDHMKCELDNEVHRAFPGWDKASRVFYGPEENV
jgi:hypothetical protein